jgi:ElaB/YqjD/DUF883 family membrane-anchored ribosome-binding protein
MGMNNPFSSQPSQDPVPPLSGKTENVERESAEDARDRAGESARLKSVAERRECCDASACQAMADFVRDHPCLSVGLAFGLGLVAGRCAAIDY